MGGRVFMGKIILIMLYIVFAFILGILSVVLKKKHTQLYNKSTPLHEASVENGAEKIEKDL